MAQDGDAGFGSPAAPRYSAYISYNHRDRRQAVWLHRALETYRIPRRMRGRASPFGPLESRLLPVFRDRDELAASADLAQSVRVALGQSQSLIVICSPNGAQSRWVNEEIRTFTALGRGNRIQCLIVAGEPYASTTPGADPAQECFPAALLERANQPLAADLRKGQDGPTNAKLKLLAGVLGVGYDELRQREQARRTQRLAAASVALGLVAVIMTALAGLALVARNEAVRQRDIARQKTITAERTVDFVKSLFAVSDPSEARGATVTAREILDRGATQIQTGLADEPSVKAELTTTLGEVYGALGLYRRGEALVRQGMALPKVDVATRARQYAALGDAQSRQGDYAGAARSFRRGLADAAHSAEPAPALTSRLWDGLGGAQSGLNDDAGSDVSLNAALKLDLARGAEGGADVARDLEDLAFNDVDKKRYAQARARMEQALAIRLKTGGERHPKVAEDLNALGVIEYSLQRPAQAEAYYRRALAAYKIVLGPDHPDTAVAMNNLARLMIERRDFAEAEPLLKRAVAISLAQRDESFDDLAFWFDNLALAERGLGHDADVEDLLNKALHAARVHNHRNVAPVLVDLADEVCGKAGRQHEGLAMLDEAAPIMAKAYAGDPWRSAWVETIRGRCLLASGDGAAALKALALGAPAIRARWSPGSLYGARAAELLAAAQRAS
jgi:tetratricopeptide (TPR) repeat protein